MPYDFVTVADFTPNLRHWTPVGNVTSVSQNGNALTLGVDQGPFPILTFLTPSMFRLRFNPTSDYATDVSAAVVQTSFGSMPAVHVVDDGPSFSIDTGVMRVVVQKQPYALSVFRGDQLIHADTPSYNLVYIPGQEVVANFKRYPPGALYFGFGEKAGATLAKNGFSMTQFNFDNYVYSEGFIPAHQEGGPLNPAEPLYASIPFLIQTHPSERYSYGIFFDNPAQTYFNVGANDYSNMDGMYYFGALYGDLNYYFMYGDEVRDVVAQYARLTGFAPMPPRWVFGYHQGAYGYYSRDRLMDAASRLRGAGIPADGLHIDVDFQDNYRTFTHSEMKFPNARQMFAELEASGFKCSTNITPLVTVNPLDERGNFAEYPTLASGLALNEPGQEAGAFLYNTRAHEGPDADHFIGVVDYGQNIGSNPFPYPPNQPEDGVTALGSYGHYPDFGRPQVRQWWGDQYSDILNLGIRMIWQDMTCPALKNLPNTPVHTFPLDLMLNYFGSYVPSAKVHNIYVLLLLQATWEGLHRLQPERRHFIIARGGYAGMQRYAGLWTGDSASSWNFLAINVPEVLNLGLSGVPIAGCDIGGFANGSGTTSSFHLGPDNRIIGGITDYELLTRWMQLGSFLPWYRNHYNGYTKQFQEPYAYGEPVPSNCRKYIELRYRMMDLYYSAMYQCTQTGLPIARALFLNDPHDPEVYRHLDDQFFVGDDFLVAPIVGRNWTRAVYLPAGSRWYAFKDNSAPLDAPVEGGTLIPDWYAPLDLVPIYVRAGAILPTRQLEQWVGQLPENPITFSIYPGPDRSFDLYLDDGVSPNPAPHRLTRVSHQGRRIRVQRIVDEYTPPEKFFFVTVLDSEPPSSVTAAGEELADAGDSDALWASAGNAYYYNSGIRQTFVKIFDVSSDVTIVINP